MKEFENKIWIRMQLSMANVQNFKGKTGKESQLRNFEKYLEGNDVRNTVDVAIRFFHKAEKLILIN